MTDFPEDEPRQPAILPDVEPAPFGADRAPLYPEQRSAESQPAEPDAAASAAPESAVAPPAIESNLVTAAESGSEPPLFQSWSQPQPRPPARIPHFGHLALLCVLGSLGFVSAVVVIFLAMRFHLFGWDVSAKAATDIHLVLASEGILYLVTFGISLGVFPQIWGRGFFAGIQWRGDVAVRRFPLLAATAFGCLLVAILDEAVMPGPSSSPIEQMMKSPGAAWLMFGFGITLAPFFEEMFFRGFLLPSLCTGFDWIAERVSANSPVEFAAHGRPQWSARASTVAAVAFAGSPIAIYVAGHAFVARHITLGVFVFGILIPIVAILSGFLVVIATRKSPSRHDFPPLDANHHPQWSLPAMVVASALTSLPFALLHVEQQGHSLGPFLLLIAVSLVLCAARLVTRSLAASTLVHACYNFFIFTLAMIGTGGFRHFDKM
ncbi:MAG: lysostaphin resistance A-like protein [Terracidiphilus sp.]